MKIIKSNLIKISALLICSSWINLASATLIYSESVSGDLDAIGSTQVNLVEGTNVIDGVILATPPAETDRIKFVQVAGLTVDSIVLSFAGVFDDFAIGQSLSTALFNNVSNLFDDNFNAITSGASISASFFDSFGPETGPLSQDTDGAIWDFQLSAGLVFPDQPWTLTINTTEKNGSGPTNVPEPSTLAILALGFLGLASRKLRAD